MKKTILLLMALVFVLAGAAGCSGGENSASQGYSTALISGFSEMKELRGFKYSEFFNKAEISRNEEYVTEGETSAKLTIDGGISGIPEFSVFTNSFWCSLTDFTKVQALSVDVFNTDTKEHTVKISFTTRNGGTDRTSYSGKTYTLKPGKNEVIFEIDRAMAGFVCYIDKVEYITFTFDNSQGSPYVLYMDNLKAHLTEKPAEKLEKTYKPGEILLFDDKVDRCFVKATTIRAIASEAGELSLNRNPDYIKNGTGSLKCTVKVNPSTSGTTAPAITVSGQPLEQIDFTKYSQLKFSVMCDKELGGNMNFSIELYDENGVFYNSIDHIRNYIPWGEPIPADTWFELVVDLNDVAEQGLDLEKINTINMYYGTPSTGEAYSWYVDDLMLVE